MQVRCGKFGPFLGCTKYPECRGIVNIPKQDEIPAADMPSCVAIGCDGKMVARRSRFGKPFFSCTNFPDCDVIVNDLDDLQTKYPAHPKTAYVKKNKFGAKKGKEAKGKGTKATKEKAKGKPKKTALTQKTYELSAELQAIVGAKDLSRPEVTKKVWEISKRTTFKMRAGVGEKTGPPQTMLSAKATSFHTSKMRPPRKAEKPRRWWRAGTSSRSCGRRIWSRKFAHHQC